MKIETLFSRVRKQFPEVTMREVIELVNEALLEYPDLTGKAMYYYMDIVSGQRFYGLPDAVESIREVYYKNSEGNYLKINRLSPTILEAPDFPSVPTASATPEGTVAGPENLAGVSGEGGIDLSWDAVTGAVVYLIYRDESSPAESFLTSASSTNYSDATAIAEHTYYYRVKALVGSVQTNYSDEISVYASPVSPDIDLTT